MLQRIFLPRRFSSHAISMAYEGFASERDTLKMVIMSAESKTATMIPSSMKQQVPPPEKLPRLVLEVCQQIAQLKTHQSISYTAYQRPNDEDYADDMYRGILLKTFQSFLSECDKFSQRLETSYPTCLVRGLALAADNYQEEGSSLIQTSDLIGIMIQRNGAMQAIHTVASNADIHSSLFKLSPEDHHMAASIIDSIEALVGPSLRVQLKEMEYLTYESFQALNSGSDGCSGSVDSQWLVSFLRSLTPSIRSSLPQLLDSIRALANRPMLLKHIIELGGISHALDDFSVHDDSTISDDHRPYLQLSPSIAAMLTQRVVDILHSQLHRCQVVLLLLSLLQDVGGSFISPSLLYDIKDKHQPQVWHDSPCFVSRCVTTTPA